MQWYFGIANAHRYRDGGSELCPTKHHTATLGYADTATRFARATLLHGVLADKDRMEALVMQTDLEYTLVRPTILTSGRATGRYRVADDESIRGGLVSRADVAAFVVGELSKREWKRRAPSIGH